MRFSDAFKSAIVFDATYWQNTLNQRCTRAWLDSNPSGAVNLQTNGWECSNSPRYRLLCVYLYAISFPLSDAQTATKLYIGNATDGWMLEYNLSPPEPNFIVTGAPAYFAPKSIMLAYPV